MVVLCNQTNQVVKCFKTRKAEDFLSNMKKESEVEEIKFLQKKLKH